MPHLANPQEVDENLSPLRHNKIVPPSSCEEKDSMLLNQYSYEKFVC